VDWIYSDAHLSRVRYISCVFFIDHVCLAPAWTTLDGEIISDAPASMHYLGWRNYFGCARRMDFLWWCNYFDCLATIELSVPLPFSTPDD
jgi:hypothetical protein